MSGKGKLFEHLVSDSKKPSIIRVSSANVNDVSAESIFHLFINTR